jgi:hypothetical protein
MTEIPSELPVPALMLERQREVLVAHVAGAERRRMRRRVALVVAVGVLLAALVAAPALGLTGKLGELFEGPPAPPEVQKYFADFERSDKRFSELAAKAGVEWRGRDSRILPGEARGVIAIETVDGPIRLWAAPTEDGGQCWILQFDEPAGLSSSCDGPGDPAALRPAGLWAASRPSVRIVHVRVYDADIVNVDAHTEDGEVVRLPVVAGHALGTYEPGMGFPELVGRDADGDEVARFSSG